MYAIIVIRCSHTFSEQIWEPYKHSPTDCFDEDTIYQVHVKLTLLQMFSDFPKGQEDKEETKLRKKISHTELNYSSQESKKRRDKIFQQEKLNREMR